MRVYDFLAQRQRVRGSEFLSNAEVRHRLSGLDMTGLKGGVAYSDGQFDDIRLALSLARKAAQQGATLLNYAAVFDLLKDRGGTLEGVMMHDQQTQQEYEIKSRLIVNATGVFSDSFIAMDCPHVKKVYRISQGSYIVLPAEFLPGNHALLIPKTRDGRVLFYIPWYGRLLIGTTDIEVPKADEEPQPQEQELDFLLDTCCRSLLQKPDRSAVLSMFSRQRPLVNQSRGGRLSS